MLTSLIACTVAIAFALWFAETANRDLRNRAIRHADDVAIVERDSQPKRYWFILMLEIALTIGALCMAVLAVSRGFSTLN